MPSAHAFDMGVYTDLHGPDQNLPVETLKGRAVTMTEDILQEDDRSSDESDNDEHEDQSKAGVSQQRITQNAKFKDLLAQRADTGPIHDNKLTHDLPDAQLSTAHLVAKQDLGIGTLDPREYQLELFERAKAQNTIAVLDTGSGKTLIAVLLLKHTLEKELNDRAEGKQHRIAFFLVDSVTLAYQQAAVLRNNLDQSVGHFFGAMGTDLWSKSAWEQHFQKNMVIVCTAEILNQCLLNSYVKMSQINLLIFDEAHHTKKDHPYARIIRESYLEEDPSKRPRIFGMTASPIDTKGDIVDEATRLEKLLDSRIATTSNMSLLRQVVRRPVERVWSFNRLEQPFATSLYKQLEDRFGDMACLEGIFRFAWQASSELGRWCSDRAWARALADDVLPKLEGNVRKTANSETSSDVPESAYKEILRITEASEIVKGYEHSSPETFGQLSPKVQVLREELVHYFGRPTETKCIVFTQKRYTALILSELFQTLNIPFLRPGVLIGVRSGDLAGMNITFRQQFISLVKFRTGEINCLFATSVAEEGLDIPDCNLVVRFDLYQTLIQYVQSRGRARHFNSTYASMVERGNLDHEQRLLEVQDAEKMMQNFCRTLPEDRLLYGIDHDLDTVLQKDEGNRTFKIKSTGAKLTYHSATAILARYATSLQYEKEISAQVTYVVLPINGAFVCEVILPEKSPIRGLTGSPAMKKSMAKRSAAFDTCLLLRKNKLLDDHFNSIYHRRLPAMRNAKLAITSKRTSEYDMISKPSLWGQKQGMPPKELHGTVITFLPSSQLSHGARPLLLFTRERLPHFPQFPIFLDDDIETTILTTPLEKQILLSKEEVDALTVFTLRVFRDVFHKTYDNEPEKMAYWLAPVKVESPCIPSFDPRQILDWESLNYVRDNDSIPFSTETHPENLVDLFVFDAWDGRCRFFTIAIEDSLTPSAPPPPFVARRRHMTDIMNYCSSLSKNSRAKFMSTCHWDQPVLRAELVRLRRNLLDRMTDTEREVETRCFICLEPLKVSAIPAATAFSCLAFPAIISRIDAYLISLQGCESLNLTVKLDLALEAFTKDSDNTEEHRAQQIHVQRGMGRNYERLEFLGDCFLKMATSIALFTQNPDDDEFDYHVNRMCLICNKNLFNAAVKKEIYKYIRSRGFSRHTWYPEGLKLLQGKDHSRKATTESKHALAEKTIADVCEALIGASLLSGGPEHRFDMAVKAVTTLVNSPSHMAKRWKDYISLYTIPKYQRRAADGAEIHLCRKVEEKLSYRFRYPTLLGSAFTHPSYPSAWAKVPCYQRLEFLGDSLIDMVCVEDLFARYPDRDPQWLTEHKMAMVSNKFLGALAVKLGLHTHLKYFSAPLQSQITQYAEEIQTAEGESEGAVDYWTVTKDPPKCLPDMVEAYVGAVFVDSGFNFEVIEKFFRDHIKPFFEDMAIYDSFANKHPTTFLYNRLTNEFGCMNYCLKAGEMPSIDGAPAGVLAAVIVHDVVIAEGTASSGRYAKVKASERALAVLNELSSAVFQRKYHCDCRESGDLARPDIGTAI
ncbi:ATP-dependent helicase dcl1 [Aspergillus eucalypticola CBS 122712]|uniref:Dicer-like protein 1 n=1 Tax=Aspergillus eucalypticola (strain CBS 122712 / IBT 29274) TaxID=1448314 RepID=A0A317VKK3_ASPEC|nr:ATP-dependent helicase dcl1 [Aspergillus eucalypticola CBS 122712]PWY74059.1 ATP-dependent helicase dcl1 [Aspergillus eucalypticola CBS 122712]